MWFGFILRYLTPSLPDFLGCLVRGDLSAPFYFMVALVQFILIAPLLRQLAQRCSPILLVPAAMILTLLSSAYCNDILQIFLPGANFPYNDRIFPSYLVYYLAGCCAGQRYHEFLTLLEENKVFLAALTSVSAAVDLFLAWLRCTGRQTIYFSFLTSMLFYLSAIAFCFVISLRLPRLIPRWLAKIDRASFLIYLYHSLALSGMDELLYRLNITKVSACFLLRAAFAFTATPIACVLWQELWAKGTHKLLQQQK